MQGKDQQKRALKAVQAALVQANHVVTVGLNRGEAVNVLEQVKLNQPSSSVETGNEKSLEFQYIEKLTPTPFRPSLGETVMNSLTKIANSVTGKKEANDMYQPEWPSKVALNDEEGWADE